MMDCSIDGERTLDTTAAADYVDNSPANLPGTVKGSHMRPTETAQLNFSRLIILSWVDFKLVRGVLFPSPKCLRKEERWVVSSDEKAEATRTHHNCSHLCLPG